MCFDCLDITIEKREERFYYFEINNYEVGIGRKASFSQRSAVTLHAAPSQGTLQGDAGHAHGKILCVTSPRAQYIFVNYLKLKLNGKPL